MSTWWVVCLLCTALASAQAAVLRYSVERVLEMDVANLPENHWAKYNTRVFNDGTPSFVSDYDDAPYFESINISSPFFSHDSVPWHVSSDGFLSPTPSPMCRGFCTEAALDTLFGYYRFGEDIYDGGGDWPMIGLYVRDLNPKLSPVPSSVRVLGMGRRDGHGYEHVVVEYREVPLTGSTRASGTLTAQVEVWANGTIVMRYLDMPQAEAASVGLVLSKAERILSNTQSGTDAVAAIRYEPTMDTCADIETELDCIEINGECGWCTSTRRCVASLLAHSTCPRDSFYTQNRSPSDYYEVTVDRNVRLIDIESLRYSSWPVYDQHLKVDLGFEFPFFTMDQLSRRTGTVHLLSSGLISVFSETQQCGAIWNMCPNGNYTFSIIPFAATGTWGPDTAIKYANIPKREDGDVLCERPECPPGFIVEVKGVASRTTPYLLYTYQVYLDEGGAVEFRYGPPVPAEIATDTVLNFFAFPPPFIGLFRYRVDDPATIVVPPLLIQQGTRIRFNPTGRCNDCGLNGTCDAATSKCVCSPNFTGDFCDQCLPHHYGPKCLPCRQCQNGGVCDDGMKGTGACNCTEPFSGQDCTIRCKEPYDCSECNPRGGYCLCGLCVCDATSGWGGPHCDTLADPCRALSLDGCNYCNSNVLSKCGFCFDRMCFSNLLIGTPNEYTCSYAVPSNHSDVCVLAVQPPIPVFDLGFVIIALLLILGALVITLLLLIARLMLRTRSVYDAHRVGPSGGAPNYRHVRRVREVVQGIFLRPDASDVKRSHVIGIPLRQIPLQKLYESALEDRSRRKR